MKPSTLFAPMALLAMAVLLGRHADAAPPRVLSMVPENGDFDVDPALTTIRVTFDQDMSTSGRSICGGGPTFPTMTGQPTWESPRVLVIPVALKPGSPYQLSMNCRSAKNFRSASGEPAEITPLGFRTAAEGVAPATQPALTPERNRAAIASMRAAIEEAYSYRDRVVTDWDAVFDDHHADLETAGTPAAFARAAGRTLSGAQDPHVWLRVNDASFASTLRLYTPNVDGKKIPASVQGVRQLNTMSAAGVINQGTPSAIGYILIGAWPGDASMLRPAHDELTAMINAGVSRLIVDVRANGGGDELTARAFASRFTAERSVYSQNRIRNNAGPSEWAGPFDRAVHPLETEAKDNPRAAQVIADAGGAAPPPFKGKIVVLQGPACMSSNESFLLMMRHGANATLIGATSAGSSGNPKPHDLGNGVTLFLPSWEDMEPDGTVVEGRGVKPDTEVAFDAGAPRDTIIDAAVKLLESP